MESRQVRGKPASSSTQNRSQHSPVASSSKKRELSPEQSQKPNEKTTERQGRAVQDEEDEELSASQRELDEHYVTMRTDVVGVQYYRGLVGKGECVMLRRQPENQYDRNAVQVVNASNVQVGHIPRAVAALLAPLMDGGLINVEGRMVGQNLDRKMHYKLAMDMSIFARPSHRPLLEPELVWATPGQRGFQYLRDLEAGLIPALTGITVPKQSYGSATGVGGSSNGSSGVGITNPKDEEIRRLLAGLQKVGGDEKQADDVMSALTSDINVAALPTHPSPPSLSNGALLTELLTHQSQALQWMISHENPTLPTTTKDPAVQFWVRQKSGGSTDSGEYWLNVATRTPQDAKPQLGRGGIIADGMGLDSHDAFVGTPNEEREATQWIQQCYTHCNWEKQLRDHIAPGQIIAYTYYGPSKDVTATTLSQYDVVLTTYQTVAGDHGLGIEASPAKGKGKKAKLAGKDGPLLQIKWKRVVADEGHVLKNARAKMTQAFASLNAERRWVCTGTPIVNSPSDLGSLLTCIRVCSPLDKPEYFKSLLLRPLKSGNLEAGRLLQALVGQILLRRTKDSQDDKGKKLVELPPIEYYQCVVELDEESRKLYDEVHEESKRRFEQSLNSREGSVNILSMLTRMRQLCLCADLVPPNYLEDLRRPERESTANATSVSSLSLEEKVLLLDKLRQAVADQEECSVCFDVLEDPRITDCGHPFCYGCIAEVIHRQSQCPMDRHPLSLSSLLELPPEISPSQLDSFDDDDDFHITKVNSSGKGKSSLQVSSSSKITELVKYLHAFEKGDKSLVFSQFTSFLDRVAVVLEREGIPFCRFDGSMSAKKRQQVISLFQTPLNISTSKTTLTLPVVMLISLKSGAVGLNLTAASNVFLCDPWWQSAIEAQAIDRVHRMGQKKTVRVFQLIAENTIEAKVLEIQKRKDALVSQAFEKSGKENKAAKKEARFEELCEIFGVKQRSDVSTSRRT